MKWHLLAIAFLILGIVSFFKGMSSEGFVSIAGYLIVGFIASNKERESADEQE